MWNMWETSASDTSGLLYVPPQTPGTGGLSHRRWQAPKVSGKLKRRGGKERWRDDGSRDK